VPVEIKSRKGVTSSTPMNMSATMPPPRISQAEASVPQGGHRHRRQCQRHQRWRGRSGAGQRGGGESARSQALARIVAYGHAGVEPSHMGIGPCPPRATLWPRPG
jgi:acetyl-CoA C-acetyltransferase